MLNLNCSNSNCPINFKCYTFMREPGDNQEYECFEFTKKKLFYGPQRIVIGCGQFVSMPAVASRSEYERFVDGF